MRFDPKRLCVRVMRPETQGLWLKGGSWLYLPEYAGQPLSSYEFLQTEATRISIRVVTTWR